MTGTITLYQPIHAPDGQPVYTDSSPLTSYADDGWVDDPAKVGVNPWGEDHERDVATRHLKYLCGELPGIAPGYGKGNVPRCAIWNTVATDVSELGRDRFCLNSPRAGWQMLHLGVGRGDGDEPRRTREGSPDIMAGRSAPIGYPAPGGHDEFVRRRGPMPGPYDPATG